MSAIQLFDLNGEQRFTGTSVGGGAAPTTREQLFGNSTNIANGAEVALPLNGTNGPNSLLDITVPTAPTIKTTGVYAVGVYTNAIDAMTATGGYLAKLELDPDDEDAAAIATPVATANVPNPVAPLACVYYLEAGDKVTVTVTNQDGVSAIHFAQTMTVQRLS